MEIKIPEPNKKQGVCYATSDEGIELPIVDITHPSFAYDEDRKSLEIIAERSIHGFQKSTNLPEKVLRAMAKKSIMIQRTMTATGEPMDGMTTYLLKLGPDNLGEGYASDIDRQLAATISPLAMRMRLRDVACLMARSLREALVKDKSRPLHLINLASGPAIDSLNVLIMIRKENPDWLADRSISIHAYDIELSGPVFGARALVAMRSEGAPLSGLDVNFLPAKYDWSKKRDWLAVVTELDPERSILGISSEGGLLEYGSDREIQQNLLSFSRIPGDFPFVGSVVRNENLPRTIRNFGKFPLRLFDMDTFTALIQPTGWHIAERVSGNPIYQVVCLKKDSDPPTRPPAITSY